MNEPIADADGALESVPSFGPMKSRLLLRVVVALSFLHFAVVLDAQPRELPRRTVLGAAVVDKDGVEITSVTVGGGAERAGLRPDDLVTAIGDDTVANSTEFVSLVKRQVTDHPVLFHIRRGDIALALPVMLDHPPNELDPAVTTSYETVTVQGTLRRTLVTVPKGPARPRAGVLILSGIGCFSVDNAASPQDAYMRVAHDLSRRGFVVMRLEKSGMGDSQGPACMSVDFNSEMESYAVALAALQHDSRVDAKRTYLLGHSIGSLIAPRLANRHRVAGVIVAECVGRNWIEYELWNLRRQLELGGETPADIDAELSSKEICMHRLLVERQPETEIEQAKPDCRIHNAYPAPAKYMRQVAALNVAEPWTALSLPVLVVYGTADFVTTEADHRRVAKIVNDAHPGTATLKLISGMDHHLDSAGTQQQAYDLRIKQHRPLPYTTQFSTTVADWLCQHERCAKHNGPRS